MAHRSTSQGRNLAGLVGWFLLLGIAVALFTGLDDPRLATPPLTDLSAWGDWAAGNDPIMATVALLRLLLIGLTWYLLGASTVQVVARLTRSMAMMRVADAISVPLVRRVVSTTLGMGLAASMVTGATGTGVAPSSSHGRTEVVTATARSDAATMTRPTGGPAAMTRGGGTPASMSRPAANHGGAPATMARMAVDTAATTTDGADGIAMEVDLATPDDGPTMRHADDRGQTAVEPAVGRVAATLPRMAVAGAPAAESHAWTVRAGDHLWHIAEAVMGQHLGRAATDDEITPYWQRLIEANRDGLPDPNNPDLIVPGLELVLPNPDPGTV